MANDCSTTYKIVGETAEVQSIYQTLCTLREKHGEEGFLLADIVYFLGANAAGNRRFRRTRIPNTYLYLTQIQY